MMESFGGAGKVAVLVTAETKQAIRQLQDVNKQTKKTAKTSEDMSKSMGKGVKKFGIIAAAALAVVTGGFMAMLKASSYAGSYTKRWQAEQTMIANEWVRRHGGIFDRITKMYVDIRTGYVGTGKSLILVLEEASLLGKLGVKPMNIIGDIGKNLSKIKPVDLFGDFDFTPNIRKSSMLFASQIGKNLSKIKATTTAVMQDGSKRLLDYASLWINTYIRPILDFIKSIFAKVTDIVALIPGIGINVSYSSGGGGGGGDDENNDDEEPPIDVFGWDTPQNIMALGAI